MNEWVKSMFMFEKVFKKEQSEWKDKCWQTSGALQRERGHMSDDEFNITSKWNNHSCLYGYCK